MKKTKVVILDGGFGGVYTALRLDKTLARRNDVEVTLVMTAHSTGRAGTIHPP